MVSPVTVRSQWQVYTHEPLGPSLYTDINECDMNLCSGSADCNNTEGSYTCQCQSGFSGDGFTCSGKSPQANHFPCISAPNSPDINECMEGTDGCNDNATCMNIMGSYFCLCLPGYSGDGMTCEGIFAVNIA